MDCEVWDMYKVALIGIAFAALMFLFQRLLFCKTGRRILHFLPVFVHAAVYAVSVGLCVYDALHPYGFMFYTFVGALTAAVNTVGLIGVGIAWLFEKV